MPRALVDLGEDVMVVAPGIRGEIGRRGLALHSCRRDGDGPREWIVRTNRTYPLRPYGGLAGNFGPSLPRWSTYTSRLYLDLLWQPPFIEVRR